MTSGRRGKKSPGTTPATRQSAITAERFTRLARMVTMVHERGRTRSDILKFLQCDLRCFYRDLEFLRQHRIMIQFHEGKYRLDGDLTQHLDGLPFPDPILSLGEMRQLAKGRSKLHQKLRSLIASVLPQTR